MRLVDLQAEAIRAGIATKDGKGKVKTKAALAKDLEKKLIKPKAKTPEPDFIPEPPKPKAKAKPKAKVSALDKLHKAKSVEGKDKFYPFCDYKQPFSKDDTAIIKSSKGEVSICLTPLRGERALETITNFLNNRKGVTAQDAGAVIASCILFGANVE